MKRADFLKRGGAAAGTAFTQGAHNKPTVKSGCVGCGLCEEACIVKDPKAGRAIRVRSERRWA